MYNNFFYRLKYCKDYCIYAHITRFLHNFSKHLTWLIYVHYVMRTFNFGKSFFFFFSYQLLVFKWMFYRASSVNIIATKTLKTAITVNVGILEFMSP